jgi:hypothetical protein
VINDPQLSENEIIVPLNGAGGKLTSTISSPIKVHGVTKVPAGTSPGLGEHTVEILGELGFDAAASRACAKVALCQGKGHACLIAQKHRTRKHNMSDIHHRASGGILRVEFNRPSAEERDDQRHVHAASRISSTKLPKTRRPCCPLALRRRHFLRRQRRSGISQVPRAGRNPAARLMDALHQVRKADRRGRARRGGRRRDHDADALRFRLRRREREVQACRSFDLASCPSFGSSFSMPARIGHLRAAELIPAW